MLGKIIRQSPLEQRPDTRSCTTRRMSEEEASSAEGTACAKALGQKHPWSVRGIGKWPVWLQKGRGIGQENRQQSVASLPHASQDHRHPAPHYSEPLRGRATALTGTPPGDGSRTKRALCHLPLQMSPGTSRSNPSRLSLALPTVYSSCSSWPPPPQ